MILQDDLQRIGYVKRPHGFKGEIQIELNKEIALNKGDFVFIQLEGQFIPYKILSLQGKEKEPLLKLEFIDNYEDARHIAANEVYVFQSGDESKEELDFTGFEVWDKKLAYIGRVKALLKMPQQDIIVIDYQGKECLIPFVEEFVLLTDEEKKRIDCDLPNGLLEL